MYRRRRIEVNGTVVQFGSPVLPYGSGKRNQKQITNHVLDAMSELLPVFQTAPFAEFIQLPSNEPHEISFSAAERPLVARIDGSRSDPSDANVACNSGSGMKKRPKCRMMQKYAVVCSELRALGSQVCKCCSALWISAGDINDLL